MLLVDVGTASEEVSLKPNKLNASANTRLALLWSIAQDLTHWHTVSPGSGSKKLVTLLNRLGHGLSGTEVQEVEA